MKEKKIKLMVEYGQTVLWGVHPDDIGPINAADLPITEDLKRQISAWAIAYDETLNEEDVSLSGFASVSDQTAFENEGVRLCQELQRQLGKEWMVIYHSG